MIELKLQDLDNIIKAGNGMDLDSEELTVLYELASKSKYEPVKIIELLNILTSPVSVIQRLMCLYGLRLSEAKMSYGELSDIKLN